MAEALRDAGCIAPEAEADQLIEACAGDAVRLEELVRRRTVGEPLAWLTGSVTFCGLRVRVMPGVYVPRPQTELLARRASALLPAVGVAVDLCTGAGPIAMVLSAAASRARVVATERDPVAVRCARANGVEVFAGSLDEPLPASLRGRVDVLTAVPPYVPSDAMRLLPRDVREHESRDALDGGPDGTDRLRQIVSSSASWLRAGGSILMEVGGNQAEPMAAELTAAGFAAPQILVDAEGDTRGVCAVRPGGSDPAP